jgi:hypothetical protein
MHDRDYGSKKIEELDQLSDTIQSMIDKILDDYYNQCLAVYKEL